VIEAVCCADGLAQGEVTGQHDVLATQRDDEGTLRRPRAYPGDLGERRDQLVVRRSGQHLRVKPPVRAQL
jgi:hypothetical protein